ncbi:transposase [Longibaculum muris]|uniref:transposase n=1 Tax=Longibaculum muris TaxID=1796628 RepID=UPI00189EE1B2
MQLHSHIHTIKGISSSATAGIYAEFGNIFKFETFNQMLAYAGLDPPKYESSEENHKGYMVKHNSSHLRQLIMNASDSFVLHNLCCISISVQKEK